VLLFKNQKSSKSDICQQDKAAFQLSIITIFTKLSSKAQHVVSLYGAVCSETFLLRILIIMMTATLIMTTSVLSALR